MKRILRSPQTLLHTTQKIFVFGLLSLLIPSISQAQYVDLDFNEANYEVVAKPIGATGATYSMTTIADVSGSVMPPGFADGTLEMAGDCANCGRTVRITFSPAVELLISGKTSAASWFEVPGDGFWNVSSSDGTFVLSDPLSELQDVVAAPSDVTFNGIMACQGAGVSPCQDWSISSSYISTIDVQFAAGAGGTNGSAIRFRIANVLPTSSVPTLSQWGMIIFGLLLLNMVVLVLMKSKTTQLV